MEKRKGARWLWAGWALAAGGCGWVAGLEHGYYVVPGGTSGEAGGGSGGAAGTGGSGTGGGAGAGGSGSGGAGGGDVCTPEGKQCVEQTCVDGKCVGECGPEDVRCSENRPQRCDGRGAWEDAEPCGAAAPACDAGKCVPRSCVGLAETCGPDSNESCCATGEAVPGGTFNRSNDAAYPATVSGFLLDRFEVTVGRFRKFVEAYPGSKPAAGAGAHPLIAGSGWDAVWASSLPADAAALKLAVKCDSSYQTWTDAAGDREHLPMNCLNWYMAFAFCAWDGGRLATEAEWNYAAAGGDEQREYPWSAPASTGTVDASHAVYDCTGDGSASGECASSDIQAVGSRSPAGDGRWKQVDLAGNLREWVLDWYGNYSNQCNNCANTASASSRVRRGGVFNRDASDQLSSARGGIDPSHGAYGLGARCARTP
ncbi:formylglycine-generating enzyme family protein [Sorangium sp. So ce145]|uniref:formylglycine-generating enzyme family protein n=1 Tax=Sorangium sp. So ce145 TaxID=3133285 RepID=UPI003F60DCCE